MKKFLAGMVLALALVFTPISCTENPENVMQNLEFKEFYNGVMIKGVPHYTIQGDLATRELSKFLVWVDTMGFKKIVLTTHSGGGGLYEAMRIINFMDYLKRKGVIIETRNMSRAASGAFITFISGSKGYRFAHRDASFMTHGVKFCNAWSCKEYEKLNQAEKAMFDDGMRFLRTVLKNAGLGDTTIEEFIGDDLYLSTAEMIELRLVDGEI